MAKKNNNKAQNNAPSSRDIAKYMKTRIGSLPIGDCYISEDPDDGSTGLNVVIITRLHPGGTITAASFLVDKYCLGIKDSGLFFSIKPDDFKELLNRYEEHFELKKVDYNYAHNLIYGALAYAEDLGFSPCFEFEINEYILQEDTDDIPQIDIEFGHKGKPFLIEHNPIKFTSYYNHLLSTLGPDGFNYISELRPSYDYEEGEDEPLDFE